MGDLPPSAHVVKGGGGVEGELQHGPVEVELHDGSVLGALRHDPDEREVKNVAGIDNIGQGVKKSGRIC